jgi:NAD(P)-dependent dehydrogenase (short-subunit alcohol dehydrogenase family)
VSVTAGRRRRATGQRVPADGRQGRLSGKRIVVTGGTVGIGRACVLRFLEEGASVVVGAREKGPGRAFMAATRELYGSGRASFVSMDVSHSEAVHDLVDTAAERLGGLDVACSVAGIYERGTALETDDELWRRVIDIDLSGPFYLVRHALPHLIASGSGSVILTASELGLVGTKASVAYCAAKGGVINLTRALAVDAAGTGVRVNCIAPGPIETRMLERTFEVAPDPAAARQAQLAPVLLGRFGRPEEVAALAVFLASDESSYMTGSVVVADGGVTAWYGF